MRPHKLRRGTENTARPKKTPRILETRAKHMLSKRRGKAHQNAANTQKSRVLFQLQWSNIATSIKRCGWEIAIMYMSIYTACNHRTQTWWVLSVKQCAFLEPAFPEWLEASGMEVGRFACGVQTWESTFFSLRQPFQWEMPDAIQKKHLQHLLNI